MSTNETEKLTNTTDLVPGFAINSKALTPLAQQVITPEAATFLRDLHRKLNGERQNLLEARTTRQAEIDGGKLPEYLDKNSAAVTGDWKVAPIPKDLMTRRVEITGPANSAKMVINMLNRTADGARADAAMLDFEDSMKPSWDNVMNGVVNVKGAAGGGLTHSEGSKSYALNADDMAVVIVRPRGLHLDESNVLVDGDVISGALLDTALNIFHSAKIFMGHGKTPAFYIPKCEHHTEAAWWNKLFVEAQNALGIPQGTLRATFLIETLAAAFQMEEILFAVKDHIAGLNVGRWDKIFSDIKTLKNHPEIVLADRSFITMDQPWMENYAKRLVKICHSRGAFAMGGMAAFTPGKSAELRDQQLAKVLADKQKEADLGHDGCWVSHPFFIGAAMEAFTTSNQLDVMREEDDKYPDLLPQAVGPKTMGGLRTNLRVGIAYINGWNQDIGCIAWDNLMEDLATLEISRAQTWQWLNNKITLEDGSVMSAELVKKTFDEELARIEDEIREEMAGASADKVEATIKGFHKANEDAKEIFTRSELPPFLSMASDVV